MSQNQESSKAVTVSITVGNTDRYQFTVEVPRDFVDHKDAIRLTGTSATGENIKLRDLGPVVMELLCVLRHANSFECTPEEKGTWKLRPDRHVRKSWPKLRMPIAIQPE